MLWLAKCESGGSVGVETDDDVVARDASGTTTDSEQDKLSYQERDHPFQDRGKGLWNTLLIWLRGAGSAGRGTANLHLLTTRPVPAGAFVRRLAAPAKSPQALAECIMELRRLGAGPPADLIRIMPDVLAFTDDRIADVLGRTRLIDAADSPDGASLRAETVGLLHLPPEADSDAVAKALVGWLHDALMGRWRAKEPGWVERADFDRALHAALRKAAQDRNRERAARLVSVSDEDRDRARRQPFIDRLHEIDLDESDLHVAIDSYLRFGTESLRLAMAADVLPADWDRFFDHLHERWAGIRRRKLRNQAGRADDELGREVYFETADGQHLAPLAGRATEYGYFTSGAYHRLADVGAVGWHPQYQPTAPDARPGVT